MLDDGKLDTVSAGKRDQGVLEVGTLSNSENVLETSGKNVASGITNVGNIERTRVLVDGGNHTNATSVTTASDGDEVTSLELDEVEDLAGGDINLNGVVLLDERVRVADGAAIVGNDVRDSLGLSTLLDDLGELVLGLLSSDFVENETALSVVQDTELVARLLDLDNIHETSREVEVSADLAVNLHKLLHSDGHRLLTREGILEAVAEDDGERQALTLLVRTRGRLGGINTTHLGQHPVLGGTETLHVLLGTASHLGLVHAAKKLRMARYGLV